MIVFERVSFSYGRKNVLKDVSFSLRFNERIAVLGGSGGGKTTILRLILGLVRPDSGRILIDGDEITEMKESDLRKTRMKFSIVFQEGALFDSLTVKENVAFCIREYLDLNEQEIDGKVREILRIVDMESAIDLMPEELSGGMHRRVAIARSLAGFDPKMFLYDEPTSGLDPVNADNICKLILDLAKEGKGFMIVTHKVTDALKVAERFLFLKDQVIRFDGGRAELLRNSDAALRPFLGEVVDPELSYPKSRQAEKGGGNV